MEFISVFDVFKIGVGPSSSHTLGPWKAALKFISHCEQLNILSVDKSLRISLFGSLSLTGKGHATDLAVMMGLTGQDPVTVDTSAISDMISNIRHLKKIKVDEMTVLDFDPDFDIAFEKDFLPYHPNGMVFSVLQQGGTIVFKETYYSVGGGFIVLEGEPITSLSNTLIHPFPIQNSKELLSYCKVHNMDISDIVMNNELVDRTEDEVRNQLITIWDVMLDSMYIGCHCGGYLPGNLKVKRRAADVISKLHSSDGYNNKLNWLETIRGLTPGFQDVMKWVGSFAIAVNEVNASFGRVVTAPTNGSAGVIPAVLMYYLCFVNKKASENEIVKFLLTAGEIGSIFKKGSTISAAMGGCQAEIGVSSAMAAAALTELMGGTPDQCTIAAEVAMEHHLGMTCDPIGGLVQVPCIERNSMGAIKAINAAAIALDRNAEDIKVPLDNVIITMWETAQDMHRKYKETSEGGLATAVYIVDC
ncbi:MAG: L-serine ammonia-lyase [Saprospiraceae bacterium]|nr:L-serine ammonia-lyase [Saprospiraceae bacterium]